MNQTKEVKPFGSSDSAKEKQDERLLLEDKDYQLTFDDEDKKQPEAKILSFKNSLAKKLERERRQKFFKWGDDMKARYG